MSSVNDSAGVQRQLADQRTVETAVTERYQALLQVSQTLISIRSLEKFFSILARELRAVVNFSYLGVLIYDEKAHAADYRGPYENRVSGSRLGRVRRFAHGGVCLLVFFAMQACQKTSPSAPVKTLTLIDQAWSSREYQRRLNEELARFTQQTGIRVEFLPAPETAAEQLVTFRKLLEGGAKVPDVYDIDVIWPGISPIT